ncbi:unnamed protein product [Lactuca virosa]|uniref:Cytochrome P450 n=1 Tax=Lactuca virosa TaxID=75947 RepID=A0AAU9PSW4_9ASTR|nr:unnamed protein product [Lactuca virosa]
MAQLNNQGSWWWEVLSSNRNELTLAISAIILTALWYRWKFSSSSNGGPPLPPGPRSLPIVGYLPFLSRDLHKQFVSMANSYGPVFKFHLGSKLHVVINTPDLAKVVVREKDEIFANRNPTIAALGSSYGGRDIVWSDSNSDWRYLRKIFVQEVLSNKNLEASSCFRRDEVRKTIKNVFSKIGTSINISEIAFSTEANVLTSMVWGNTSAEKAKSSNFGAELQMVSANIVVLMGQLNVSDVFPSLAWLDLQGVERNMKRQLNRLDEIFTSIIDDRIESNSKKSKHAVGHEGTKDVLQVLLELMDQKDVISINRTQVKALLQDIMVAGTETSTTLIEWAMAEIMQNRDILKRVQEELEEIVGLDNIVEESHLPKLQYLEATIKETFRLHPGSSIHTPTVAKPGLYCWWIHHSKGLYSVFECMGNPSGSSLLGQSTGLQSRQVLENQVRLHREQFKLLPIWIWKKIVSRCSIGRENADVYLGITLAFIRLELARG